MSMNEANTCRVYITPALKEAGWENSPHLLDEQHTFTNGRVELRGSNVRRGKRKRADYLLCYTRDFPIAVVEAKPEGDAVGTGMQQAKEYAEILGLKFAYSTNGHEILEFDFITGSENEIASYPTPEELFGRLTQNEKLDKEQSNRLLTPYHHEEGYTPRYYQQIAINRAVLSIL